MKIFFFVLLFFSVNCFVKFSDLLQDEGIAYNVAVNQIKEYTDNIKDQISFGDSKKRNNYGVYNWSRGWVFGPECNRNSTWPPPLTKINPKNPELSSAFEEIRAGGNLFLNQLKKALGKQFGVSISVVYDQTVLFSEGFGSIDINSQKPWLNDDVLMMGSITKIFTSLGFLKSVQDKKLNLDDPVTTFYNKQNPPNFDMKNPFEGPGQSKDPVTLHQLSSQSSGLPREPPCGLFSKGICTEDQIFAVLNQTAIFWPGFSISHYSNLGTALLGRCVGRANNIKYETYTEDLVTNLGMKSTGFTFTPEIKKKLINGYSLINGKVVVSSTAGKELGWPAPCGGLYTTSNDMISFLKWIFETKTNNILTQSKKNEYFLPGVVLRGGATSYGMFTFEQVWANGYWTQTKGGLLSGFGSNIAFVPELKLGVFAALNLVSGSVDSLTSNALEILVPRIEAILEEQRGIPPLPSDYKSFLGNYGVNNITIATVKESTELKGYLEFTFSFGAPFNVFRATWEPIQDMDGAIGFNYLLHYPGVSCLLRTGIGSGVAYFIEENGQVYGVFPDFLTGGIAKL